MISNRPPKWLIIARGIMLFPGLLFVVDHGMTNSPDIRGSTYFVCISMMFLLLGVFAVLVYWSLNHIYGRDPNYYRWLDKGYRPVWDGLPFPFYPLGYGTSIVSRINGIPEPTYNTGYVPEDSREYSMQCKACGARLPNRTLYCFVCGGCPDFPNGIPDGYTIDDFQDPEDYQEEYPNEDYPDDDNKSDQVPI